MHNGKTNSNDFNELEFPRLAFKGILRDYAEAVAEVNNVDPAMCLMTALSTISGAVGKSFKATQWIKTWWKLSKSLHLNFCHIIIG